MSFQLLDTEVDCLDFSGQSLVPFQLEHDTTILVFLELCKILVERRDFLSVRKSDACEFRSIVLCEFHSVHCIVVEYHKLAVLSHIYVELTSPYTQILSCLEGGYGIV